MNEGKIWCYVSPNVGLPLFFLAIAVVALLVHASILTNTTWFAGYWQGAAQPAAVAAAPASTEVAVN
ncbi:MAG: light-harvesting protein [Alphaproteobacteria bacterium]|nr:MAG: light-harvesting protein [Alphaproteobacteria bacterium]